MAIREKDARPRAFGSIAGWVVVGLTLLFVGGVRLRLADVPLERDEGEYAYAGQSILDGLPPYFSAYNMKFPGTYYAYAGFLAVFGETPRGVRTGLALLNAGTVVVLFLLARRLAGEPAASVAAVSFALLSLDRGVYGSFAHATHFVLLPALGGVLLLLSALDTHRRGALFGAGVFAGVALLMKQHAATLAPFMLALIVWSGRTHHARPWPVVWRQCASLLAGAVLPIAAISLLLAAEGVWDRFWFWCFRYAFEYVTAVPANYAWQAFTESWRGVSEHTLAWWLVAAAGAGLTWFGRWPREVRVVLSGLALAMSLAIVPGFYFRPHYFVLLLPSVALFVGIAAASLDRGLAATVSARTARAVTIAAFILLAGSYLASERHYLLSMSPRELSRSTYGANPFIEAEEIARYIDAHAEPSDTIAVIGSEPEIYFLADRKSGTGYIYTYALMEPHSFAERMQHEMRQEIETAHPHYLVLVQVATSWLMRPESKRTIFEWANRYVGACYEQVGVADILSEQESRYLWGESAAGYRAQSKDVLYVFRRRSAEPCAVPRARASELPGLHGPLAPFRRRSEALYLGASFVRTRTAFPRRREP